MRSRLGVVVALPAEARLPGCGQGCEICVAGIGRGRARDAASRLIDRGARALLTFGVCGGLSDELRAGDLLLPRRVVSQRQDWPTHDAGRSRVLSALPRVREINALYCSDAPLVSPGEKAALSSRGFAAVDMESAGVAEIAACARVPFIALKAVCDPAARVVPQAAWHMLDGNGRLRAAGMFDVLRAGPRVWRQLRALRGDFGAACTSLRRAANALPELARGFAP